MKKRIFTICLLSFLLSNTACKKFLDVKPIGSLAEDELFNSEVGFQQALNGTYSQLAARSLYGDLMTMSFVSAMSQDYFNMSTANVFYGASQLSYTGTDTQNQISSIWNTAFTTIAGTNKIIDASLSKRAVLSDVSYAKIRGEALGIRAFLHFDLLRLFGPEYINGQNLRSIPYRTTVNSDPGVPLTTKQVMDLVLTDLTEAAQLLKEVDPIISAPVSTTSTRNPILQERSIRMNYFAIKGLEARVRLYKGDKEGAYAAALEVITAAKFPFSTATAISAGANTRDRLYVPEQVFMLRVRDMKTWTDGGGTYFKPGVPAINYLTLSDANFRSLYETSATDLRYLYRVETEQNVIFPSKFWQTWVNSTSGQSDLTPNRLDQNMPIIRISELYYILAETAPGISDAVGYLNLVRRARGLVNLATNISAATLEAEILKEYRKELHGEGQLFYYYKRKSAVRMQFHASSINLTPDRYILPIPLSELQFNPNYN